MLLERAHARKDMPTSLGHGLAGIAAGWAVAKPAAGRRRLWVQTAIFAAAAAAPDLDLFFSRHRAETHSLGAAVIVASAAAWGLWPVARSRGRMWLSVFAACFTHPLLDALALDTNVPFGIMAFWPISRAYVQSGIEVFDPVWRRWWLADFWTHNSVAMLKEANRQGSKQKRYERLAEAEAYLLAAQPVIPLMTQATNWMKKPYVKGLYPNPQTQHAWKFVYIEYDPAKWDRGVPSLVP
jgi:membrane-bound metal-dependent hydrolase YbcI (DUF457 family)